MAHLHTWQVAHTRRREQDSATGRRVTAATSPALLLRASRGPRPARGVVVVVLTLLLRDSVRDAERALVRIGRHLLPRRVPKDGPQLLEVAWAHVLRVLHLELDEQVAALDAARLGHRHALAPDLVQAVRVQHEARRRRDAERAAVEVLHDALEAGEGLGEGDGALDEQVVALAGERVVGLLVENDDDVTREPHARDLVALARERDVIATLRAALDVDLEDLLLLDRLLAVARLAAVLGPEARALAVAVAALHLHLLDEARAELAGDELDAAPLALVALGVDTRLVGAAAVARRAEAVARDGELGGAAHVEVLERHGQLVHDVLGLRLAAGPAAAAEHRREDVGRVHAAGLLVDALLAVVVVALALLLIG
mmetsp:Transcript_26906/g.83239  ORF Transcript_26906/g.83239 Transcript_26906/m.83239 type:complete len:370 (+) Transcript_26906:217-1326(+)